MVPSSGLRSAGPVYTAFDSSKPAIMRSVLRCCAVRQNALSRRARATTRGLSQRQRPSRVLIHRVVRRNSSTPQNASCALDSAIVHPFLAVGILLFPHRLVFSLSGEAFGIASASPHPVLPTAMETVDEGRPLDCRSTRVVFRMHRLPLENGVHTIAGERQYRDNRRSREIP